MRNIRIAILPLLLIASCKKPSAPDSNAPGAEGSAEEVSLGTAAGLVPSSIEEPPPVEYVGPTTLALPPTTGTLADQKKLTIEVVLELDGELTRKEAAQRTHEYQDIILSVLADRASTDLTTSYMRDELRFLIQDTIRAAMPPRGLRKIYFTRFVIE